MSELQIRTGGQSGVDRAALDAAIEAGVEYVGWCPRGGWAEDFPDPPGLLEHYPKLVPTPSADPDQRTAWNVRDSHALLILLPDAGRTRSPGTSFAESCARTIFLRPARTVQLSDSSSREEAIRWVSGLIRDSRPQDAQAPEAEHHGFVLGIGGPRESESPGIYRASHVFILELLNALGKG